MQTGSVLLQSKYLLCSELHKAAILQTLPLSVKKTSPCRSEGSCSLGAGYIWQPRWAGLLSHSSWTYLVVSWETTVTYAERGYIWGTNPRGRRQRHQLCRKPSPTPQTEYEGKRGGGRLGQVVDSSFSEFNLLLNSTKSNLCLRRSPYNSRPIADISRAGQEKRTQV